MWNNTRYRLRNAKPLCQCPSSGLFDDAVSADDVRISVRIQYLPASLFTVHAHEEQWRPGRDNSHKQWCIRTFSLCIKAIVLTFILSSILLSSFNFSRVVYHEY